MSFLCSKLLFAPLLPIPLFPPKWGEAHDLKRENASLGSFLTGSAQCLEKQLDWLVKGLEIV